MRPNQSSSSLLDGIDHEHARDRQHGDEIPARTRRGVPEEIRQWPDVEERGEHRDFAQHGKDQEAIGEPANSSRPQARTATGEGVGHLTCDYRRERGARGGQQGCA